MQHKPNYNRYEWQADSSIRGMEVRHDQAYMTAFIEAGEGADPSVYENLPKALSRQNILFFADEKDGKQVLRVWGFKHEGALFTALKEAGAVSGKATQTEYAVKKPFHLREWITDNSVVAAGLTYLVGDALLIGSGLVRGEGGKRQVAGSAKWACTSVLLAIFGTKDPRGQMDHLYKNMDSYLEKSDLDLSDTDRHILHRLHSEAEGPGAEIKHLISEHVLTLNNVIFGLGGIDMARAGITGKGNDAGKPNPFKAFSGAAVTTGMWGAELIPENDEAKMSPQEIKEKKQAEKDGKPFNARPVDMFADPWTWLKRKPLRLAGIGAGLNNIAMAISGWGYEMPEMRQKLNSLAKGTAEYKETSVYLKASMMDGLSPAAYVVANTFYGMSPKDRRGFLKEDDYLGELYSVAAHLFSGLPPEERTIRIAQFAGNMASHKELKSSAEEIQDLLEAKIDAVGRSPWHAGMVKDRPEHRALMEQIEHAKLAPNPAQEAAPAV